MNLRDLVPPVDLPDVGPVFPAVLIRVALALLGVGLTVIMESATAWIALGALIALIAALAPEYRFGWLLVLYLAGAELGHRATLHPQLLILLAGVHLLHVLSLLALELPTRAWVQFGVLRAPLLRYLAIQIPCQVVAIVTLAGLGENSAGRRPVSVVEFGVIGAIALAGLAVVLTRRARVRG